MIYKIKITHEILKAKNFKALVILGVVLTVLTETNILYNRNTIYYFNNFEESELEHPNLKLSIIQKTFSLVMDPPETENWDSVRNNGFIFPDLYGIDSGGCYVSHRWDMSVNASRNYPSIHWKKIITMPVDMSYSNILSASVNAIINATVHGNNGTGGGIEGIGDFAEFYVSISDLETQFEYTIANYQTTADLGNDSSGTYYFLPDTYMNTVTTPALISFLTNTLESDNHTFVIILGIDIYSYANFANDIDYWDLLRIKSFNFTFTYEVLNENILPSIIITEPKFNQVYGEAAPSFNLTILEPNLDSSWYTIDNGYTNITFTSSLGFINENIWDDASDGILIIRFYANDSLANENHAEIMVIKDTTIPIITIIAPVADQGFLDPPSYWIEINEVNLELFWYTLDGGAHNYIIDDLTDPIDSIAWNNAADGPVTIQFYAKDDAGNIGTSLVTVIKENLSPDIPGYNLLLLLGVSLVLTLILTRRKLIIERMKFSNSRTYRKTTDKR